MQQIVTIGGATGAWGDSALSTAQLLRSAETGLPCDYIVFEALAEITMGILTRALRKDPARGYATDIIEMIGRDIATFRSQGVRVITNAGGVHPAAAAERLRVLAERAGVQLSIATVSGDDLMAQLDGLRALAGEGAGLRELSSGVPLPDAPLSMNAYLGARPIAAALDAGADVVITGRCVDSALALGPLIHAFGWGPGDLDALSGGSLAGHLIECGPQSTGGLLTDWEALSGCEDLGYPIVQCRADGSFMLTKPAQTGGLVDVRSAAEQLLYEIGDPARYRLPDVTCDWREVRLSQLGPDRVQVSGARGTAPPATLKACAQVLDGFKVKVLLMLAGRDAVRKAERLAADMLARADRVLARGGYGPLRAHDVEVLGAESSYGPHSRARAAREVMLKLALHHNDRAALNAIVRELPSFGLAAVGVCGGGGGLARPSPLLQLCAYAVPRDSVQPQIEIDGAPIPYQEPAQSEVAPQSQAEASVARAHISAGGHGVEADVPAKRDDGAEPFAMVDPIEVPLIAIAHARSGDKGPDANIGVRARHPDFVPLLRDQLSAAAVAAYLAHLVAGSVERYELPGIDAFNFVLHDALGGGGIASLRFDAQGKAYAQQLLDKPVRVPVAWRDHPAFAG